MFNIINRGRNTDRGLVLRQKAETKKMLLKKMRMDEDITDEEFISAVQKCVSILSESQDCMSMIVPKSS